MKESSAYSASSPFYASLRERSYLTDPGSPGATLHLILDLHQEDLTYQVGDSVGILPCHDPILVEKTIHAMKASGEEIVRDRSRASSYSFQSFLSEKADITEIQRTLAQCVASRQTDPGKKKQIEFVLQREQKEAWKEYASSREVWDFLMENAEVSLTPQELCDLLLPLRPRFYSIASSPRAVGSELHLTVAAVEYESNGSLRRGTCTHFLCSLAPLNQRKIPLYIQPAHGFHLPADPHADLIMVGPGTGVAPFRAFMQERIHRGDQGKNWLFFGECYRDKDFFYEKEWLLLEQQRQLRLDLAFSRDQQEKIYVQHRMREKGKDLFAWLEAGAYFFVCGDAQAMAKEVEAALQQIIEEHGKRDAAAARAYIKALRQSGRYQRDVY